MKVGSWASFLAFGAGSSVTGGRTLSCSKAARLLHLLQAKFAENLVADEEDSEVSTGRSRPSRGDSD